MFRAPHGAKVTPLTRLVAFWARDPHPLKGLGFRGGPVEVKVH